MLGSCSYRYLLQSVPCNYARWPNCIAIREEARLSRNALIWSIDESLVFEFSSKYRPASYTFIAPHSEQMNSSPEFGVEQFLQRHESFLGECSCTVACVDEPESLGSNQPWLLKTFAYISFPLMAKKIESTKAMPEINQPAKATDEDPSRILRNSTKFADRPKRSSITIANPWM